MIRYIAVAMLVFSSVTYAADDARKINFQTVLTDQDGNAVTECAEPPKKPEDECKIMRPVTLGMLAMRALAVQERDLPQDQALQRGQLALAVYKATDAQLSVEEIALIKKQIAKFFSPVMVVKSFALLDPAAR